MSEFLLECAECNQPFFTVGEKEFYDSKGLIIPRKCKICRDKKKNLRKDVLCEISKNWNIEARQENTNYFHNTIEAKELIDGKKYFVIGRKGTGKTAIAEHISKKIDANHFSEKLSFKNFPFNYLYTLENTKYTAPNQYITIWKYLIYSCVCKMMTKNQAIDNDVVNKLKKIYPNDSQASLARMVESWTATDFGIDILDSVDNS